MPTAAVLSTYNPTDPTVFGRSICPVATQSVGTVPIQFGYDMTTGCTVALNRSQLIDLCCAGSGSCANTAGVSYNSEYVNAATGIPYLFNFSKGLVATIKLIAPFCSI